MYFIAVPAEARGASQLLQDWESIDELQQFLDDDDTSDTLILVAGNNGVITLDGVCEWYALQLRDRAMSQGKYLSIQILHPKEYRKWYGEYTQDYHAVCMARIGSELWLIEPQTDKVWQAYVFD